MLFIGDLLPLLATLALPSLTHNTYTFIYIIGNTITDIVSLSHLPSIPLPAALLDAPATVENLVIREGRAVVAVATLETKVLIMLPPLILLLSYLTPPGGCDSSTHSVSDTGFCCACAYPYRGGCIEVK